METEVRLRTVRLERRMGDQMALEQIPDETQVLLISANESTRARLPTDDEEPHLLDRNVPLLELVRGHVAVLGI